ncbi:MAG: c-type cytochrome, partial [Ignavibacteriae bacterium]|nr:c-type cytochrome [Ignavibacteriota bacterium]
MNNLRAIFAISSVVLLVVLAVSPFKDFYREWKKYQYNYNEIIKELPQRVKSVEIGIKQIWAQKLDRVDRCTTCHLGLGETALANAEQPFRAHSRIYHSTDDFGCTICHEGQGLATTRAEAHGYVEYWDRPMLPTGFMEASCGRCHRGQKVPEAPILSLGRRLIREFNCVGCHKIGGSPKQWIPALDGIGTKVNRTWLFNWLKNPKDYYTATKMPNFLLTDDEAHNLTDFLMTYTSFANGVSLEPLPKLFTSATEAERERMIELGATRFREARCISCHPINGRGGYVAAELGQIASKARAQWIYTYIKNPKRLQPGVEMPRFRFSETDLAAVVAYIESEFVTSDVQELSPRTRDPDYFDKGLTVLKKYNCTGCHELGDRKKADEMGPELTFVGDKSLYQIDFGRTGIEHSLPAYLYTKLKSPRVFSSTMKMPDYGLSDEDARAITVALLGNSNESIPEQLKIHPAPSSSYAPQGEFGKLVDDLACFGCHTMFGRGRLVATDLSVEASQADEQWIQSYFKIPYSLRPIMTERMPNLFLADDEIKTIVNHMEAVFLADSLTREIRMDASTVAEGKALYYGAYGCQSCHQIDLKGGYVGPALDKCSTRLKPGWVFHWLKNPQAFKPETLEPNNNLSDREAEALTAFLMT